MTLQQALQQRGVLFRPSRKPGWIMLCCPFCVSRGESADQRFRLGVNTASDGGHCFNCGYKSRGIGQRLLRALRLPPVALDGDIDHPTVNALGTHDAPLVLPEGYHLLGKPLDSLDRAAVRYLLERGVSARQIIRNRIGATFLGRYAYRVIFPVYEGERLQGFVSRALNKNMKVRYLNSMGEKALYNFRPAPGVVLLEGIFKCLRVERMLKAESADSRACALLGHDITDLQLDQMVKAQVKRVVLWPDPDRVGRRGMASVAQKLQGRSIPLELVMASQPADEVSFTELRESWDQRVLFNWAWGLRLLGA